MNITLSEFLEAFPIPLHHKEPDSSWHNPWIFWSGSENSSSSDLGTVKIHEMIIYAFSNMEVGLGIICQFWVPVTIGGRRLLTTSGQPFAFGNLDNELAMYRLYSEKYKYNIDENTIEIEEDHMIVSGGHTSAFLNRLPYINQLQWVPPKHCQTRLNVSIMLPICLPSQNRSHCIGVLEFTMDRWEYDLGDFVSDTISAVEEADLDVCNVQERIPYKTINCLKSAEDEIEVALKTVCESHNLGLAHVWIACEDISTMSFSSFLEDTRPKRLLACKFTGYLYKDSGDFYRFLSYSRFCDVIPQGNREEFVLKTLEDHESRYISKLGSDMIGWKDHRSESSALTICLRSIDTGDFDFVFEFIWRKRSNFVILSEALLLTLKRCLPRFKFVSGAELDDELNVMNVDTESGSYNYFKIFQEKIFSPTLKVLEERRKQMLTDNITPLDQGKYKTTTISLPREVIEKQFGKTMKEAAKNLSVSLSTFKRKLKELGMLEWHGPNFVKRTANDSSIIQINTNEEDNAAIQDPSTVMQLTIKDTHEDYGATHEPSTIMQLTIKAEYANDMIKFRLPISQVSFVIIEKTVRSKFNLCLGTYKLKYIDEVGDLILLTSDEELSYCIESSRKLDPSEIRLHVLPSTQPKCGPSCSCGIGST